MNAFFIENQLKNTSVLVKEMNSKELERCDNIVLHCSRDRRTFKRNARKVVRTLWDEWRRYGGVDALIFTSDWFDGSKGYHYFKDYDPIKEAWVLEGLDFSECNHSMFLHGRYFSIAMKEYYRMLSIRRYHIEKLLDVKILHIRWLWKLSIEQLYRQFRLHEKQKQRGAINNF